MLHDSMVISAFRPFARVASFLAPIALFGGAAGCASYSLAEPATPPVRLFAPPTRTDVATVCVIHPSHTAIAVTFVVHDDGQLVGATKAESWFCYLAEPGPHVLVSTTGDPIDVDGDAGFVAEAGHRYWLHQDFDDVFGVIHVKLEWVERARAHELMDDVTADCKVIVGVPGNEKLPGTLPLAKAASRDAGAAQPRGAVEAQ